ncbi:hypothetical protein TNCV_41491 [Trichonephila clavipes]|nr:hypothetical protein TNCV_41491 [Trichonephila clavipes]
MIARRAQGGHLVDIFLKSENIRWMDWPVRSPDLLRIEHALDVLERKIKTRNSRPRTIQDFKKELLSKWN